MAVQKQAVVEFAPHAQEPVALNNKSSAIQDIKRKTRGKRKAYWEKNKISPNRQSRRDVKVRVSARSLILGQIWKLFFNIDNRILTVRVPQPKTTDLIPQFCLIEK